MGRGGGACVQEITIDDYFLNVVNDDNILTKSTAGNINTYTFVGAHTISEEYKITLEHNGNEDYSRIVIANGIAITCEGCLHYINSNEFTKNLQYFQMNAGSSFTMTKESSITFDYSGITSSSILIDTATFEMQEESKMDFNLVSSTAAISVTGADAQFNFGGSEINFIFDIETVGDKIALNISDASTFTMVDDGFDSKLNFSIPKTATSWLGTVKCIFINGANFEQDSGEINYNFNTENITVGGGSFTGLRVGGTSATGINLTKMVFEDFVQPANGFDMTGINYTGGDYTVKLKEDGEIIFNKWSKNVEGSGGNVRGLNIGFQETFENNGTIRFNGELDNGAIGIFIEGLNTELVLKENKGRILYNKVGSGAPGFETIVCSVGDSGKLTLESGTVFGVSTAETIELNTIGLFVQGGTTIIANEGTVLMGNVTTAYNPALGSPQYQGGGIYLP